MKAAKNRKVGRKGRKPPLHIVSDFGSKHAGRSRLAKTSDGKTRGKRNFGAK